MDDQPAFRETALGTVSAFTDRPGKITGIFEPSSPTQPTVELNAYQIGESTVVWGAAGGRSKSYIQPKKKLTPAILSDELVSAISDVSSARKAERHYSDVVSICDFIPFPFWPGIICDILVTPETLDNSDCDMSSASYDRCVADYPPGRGGACQCANCSFLCDSVVNDS